jgi:hypothetical protein
MERLRNGVHKGNFCHRLAQVGDTPGLQGLPANLGSIMRGDKDDRRGIVQIEQALLQFQAGHAAKLNVENQAVRLRIVGRREKSLARGMRKDFKSGRTKQAAERASKTVIIIHDCDINFLFRHPGRTQLGIQ